MEKKFPPGMEPLGKSSFQFRCHAAVACYMTCCRKLDMPLYPFDIIRLKKYLGLDSEEFLRRYVRVVAAGNPYFPALMMRMADNEEHTCPFLGEQGCTVYEERPAACRMYPLEKAVERAPAQGRPGEFFFMARHSYCLGHAEDRQWTVKEWLRDQHLLTYQVMDELWAEMDTLFATNPWRGEGAAGPLQQLAFMVCYNPDGFRRYLRANNLLGGFKMSRSEVRAIETDDEALLKFGYKWLRFVLADSPTLQAR
jgi:Fe-S-cluster containining protein